MTKRESPYICNLDMNRSGTLIAEGGIVMLTDEDAEQHLDSGAITPAPEPEPEPEPKPAAKAKAKPKTAKPAAKASTIEKSVGYTGLESAAEPAPGD